ncbi:phosphotransferase [Kribbella sp. NPDC051770]|uniref:phosphotransferase n=1 Tax=Kribbella sp. NPDC051770 TaxID=3155413 RepID=UPI00343CD1D0
MDNLATRFGAHTAEQVHIGFSGATVVRLERGTETLYYKAGPEAAAEADRVAWLSATGFSCPRLLDRGDDWMLTSALPGRDASQPWPAAERPAVLAAVIDCLQQLHELTDCPFTSPFPGTPTVVTHGDYCLPNVLIDPETLRCTGVLDLSRLGLGDPYVDVAVMTQSLSGGLNPQYGGPPTAREFATAYGADPDDERIPRYIAADNF